MSVSAQSTGPLRQDCGGWLMPSEVSALRAAIGRVAGFGVGLGLTLLALMASLVVLQVAARNFLDLGLPWADELARFSGIGLVFLTVPALAGRQVLVSVTLLPDLLKPSVSRWLALLADIAHARVRRAAAVELCRVPAPCREIPDARHARPELVLLRARPGRIGVPDAGRPGAHCGDAARSCAVQQPYGEASESEALETT